MYAYPYIYIYVYVYVSLSLSIYIYIYIYTCVPVGLPARTQGASGGDTSSYYLYVLIAINTNSY